MIVVAIEGYDGSGKTTLVRELIAAFKGQGMRCTEVGRSAGNSSSHVAGMTAVIKSSDGGPDTLSPLADLFLRLARLHARIDLVTSLDCDVVLLNRFLLYDLSRVPEALRVRHAALVEQVSTALHVDLTIHLTASFEVLWKRVTSRHANDLSPKERRGRAHNFQGYMAFEQVLATQRLYDPVRVIDCGAPLEEVVSAALSLVRSAGPPDRQS